MSQKGSAFERYICRKLSHWFSAGQADDWFWRSAGSGARASVRGKKGKKTEGHHGDITCTCTEGQWLTDVLTFELKRGYNKFSLFDLLDAPETAAKQKWTEWIAQAQESHEQAQRSMSWAIISRRDRRQELITVPYGFVERLESAGSCVGACCPSVRACLDLGDDRQQLFCTTLDSWMSYVRTRHILDLLEMMNKP